MSLKFSDRDRPHFASAGETVCDYPGIWIGERNPDGSGSRVHCEREQGHEGKHCGRISSARLVKTV